MTFARTQNPVRRFLSRRVVDDTPLTGSENVTRMEVLRETPDAFGSGLRDRMVGFVLSTTVTGSLVAITIEASSSIAITVQR